VIHDATDYEEIEYGDEYADVIDGEPDSLTCVCGNTANDAGLVCANDEGLPVHSGSSTPVPDGLAERPEDEDNLYTLCPVCGRVYSNKVIRKANTAPVAFHVDLQSGPVAAALYVHRAPGNEPGRVPPAHREPTRPREETPPKRTHTDNGTDAGVTLTAKPPTPPHGQPTRRPSTDNQRI
jgi:hypothetical protein